ncbi:Centrosome and spindle pole-associated protein 1 [Pitangus sulphuratus]|nr:Centrosome and spindle pole-associated protein 1 [Pitangus sulphuratus]
MMADDLDKSIEEHKAKFAQDKAELENDPPYMEMRIFKNLYATRHTQTVKMIFNGVKLSGDYGMSLPLGEEYERKKHKLKEELREDYRRYLSQKNYLTTGEVDPYTQGLSLPIDERRSAKEKLRLERNKEYNQYLRDKEEWNERLRKLGKKTRENEMNRNIKHVAITRLQPELRTEAQPFNTGAEPPKKDAFTSTEDYEELQNNKRWLEEDRYHRLDDEAELRSRLLNKRLDGDLDVPNGFASQSVIPIRKHHRLDEDRDFGRRYYRVDYDPEISDEMDPRFRCESTYDRRTPRVFHAERNQVQIRSSANEEARSAAEMRYRAGLVLGGQDRELLQRRKEKYRRELMEQMAEQQRNKRREKELELLVAASGAHDPEKTPNRLKQFGFTSRASEEKVPPERPRVAFQTPVPAPSASLVIEDFQSDKDFHRGLASTLGEIAAPSCTANQRVVSLFSSRLAPLPPPPPPVLTDNYRTPYDDAYYFYGARNPLDPALAYYRPGMMGMQPTPNLDPPLSQAPVEQFVSNIGQKNTGDGQRSIGILSEEKTQPSKEPTLSYQQELQQQIREREERRRQEREENERYEAKIEAEMRNYNPWGRGGGGAPLRDAEGNLIADLKVMHKQNEDAYLNPEARLYEDKRALVTVDLSLASSRPENTEASTNKIAGVTFAQASPFARGNVFGEPPSPQYLKQQESYKNSLRLQIEEKRRREEAEREKLRMEEEKEEKRIAEERMRIQKEYEEEQEEKRKKDEERRLKNEEIIRLDEERKKEAEKKRKEKEEKQKEQLRQYFEKEKMEEEKKMEPAQPRVPSPPVPARRNQLRSLEERKNVINELSEMRKQLRSEERRLQEQLLNAATDGDVPITRILLKFIVRIVYCKIGGCNALPQKEDSETRIGLRHMYPDPPKDDQTLEIQQRALLREQQKKLDRMRMRRETGDDSPSDSYPQTTGLFRNESDEFLKNSLLESDSAFIGANGETFPALEEVNLLPQLPSSARERRRMKQKALECAEDVAVAQTPLLQPDSLSLNSNLSLDVDQLKGKNEERLHRLTELQQKSAYLGMPEPAMIQQDQAEALGPGDDISLGDMDDLLKRPPSLTGRRPSSVDTIATEPWLRPGTSDTLRRLMAEQSNPAKLAPEKTLPRGWQGLSTAHG